MTPTRPGGHPTTSVDPGKARASRASCSSRELRVARCEAPRPFAAKDADCCMGPVHPIRPLMPRSACSTVAHHPSETITIRPWAVKSFCSSLKPPAARAAHAGRSGMRPGGRSLPAGRKTKLRRSKDFGLDRPQCFQLRLDSVPFGLQVPKRASDDATHIQCRSWANAGDNAHAGLTMRTVRFSPRRRRTGRQ